MYYIDLANLLESLQKKVETSIKKEEEEEEEEEGKCMSLLIGLV
jgi:hypothetical protein